jgi:type VI protein secretion system component Hcp
MITWLLKLEDKDEKLRIEGESDVAQHDQWITITSFAFDATDRPSTSDEDRESSIPTYQHMDMVTEDAKAQRAIFSAMTEGWNFKQAVLCAIQEENVSNGRETICYDLTDVMVSKAKPSTAIRGKKSIAATSFSLNYHEIQQIRGLKDDTNIGVPTSSSYDLQQATR